MSDDHAQTTYWRGFVGLKYLQKDPFGFRCGCCVLRAMMSSSSARTYLNGQGAQNPNQGGMGRVSIYKGIQYPYSYCSDAHWVTLQVYNVRL